MLEKIIEKANKLGMQNDTKRFETKIHSFSDTIVITTIIKKMNKEELQPSDSEIIENIGFASFIAMNVLELGLLAGFPFRGCISFGEFFENSRTVTGQALIDGAEYHKKPNWIGVSLCPSAHVKMLNKKSDDLTTYDIPLKNGIEVNGLAVPFKDSKNDLLKFYRENYPKHKALYQMVTLKSSLDALIKMSLQPNNFSVSLN